MDVRVWDDAADACGPGFHDNRRPVVYDPNRDVLHIGALNDTHYGLIRQTDITNQAWGEAGEKIEESYGWCGHNSESESNDYVYRRGKFNEFGWYREATRPPVKVHNALKAWVDENFERLSAL